MSTEKSVEETLSAMRANETPVRTHTASLDHLGDQNVLHLYEGIRHQVEADKALGTVYRLVGSAAKESSERLRQELVRRGLKFKPISWN